MKEIKIYNDPDYGLTVEYDGFCYPCQDRHDVVIKVTELLIFGEE